MPKAKDKGGPKAKRRRTEAGEASGSSANAVGQSQPRTGTVSLTPEDIKAIAQQVALLQKSSDSTIDTQDNSAGNTDGVLRNNAQGADTREMAATTMDRLQDCENDETDVTCTSSANTIAGSLIDKVLSGEPTNPKPVQPHFDLSDGIPLGATITNKIKTKIWANEYIDFRSLLHNQEEEPLSITISAGKIDVAQSVKRKQPLTINQWTDAFLVYASIYIEKHRDEAGNLMKYAHMIRELSRLYVDQAWRTYDESFRKLRESSLLPWQKPVHELRLKVATLGIRQFSNGNQGSAVKQPFRGPRKVIVTHLTKGNDAQCGPVNLSTCANNATGSMQNLTVDQGVMRGNQKKVVQKGNNLGDLPTPINPQNLKNELKDYDRDATQYLVRGIEEGFRLGCLHSPSIHPPHNHKSALEHKEVVHEYIIKGKACDRIAGPFESPPLSNFKVSPLGVVPKSEQGKFRIIHDLSFPENNSVNSNIPVK